jgi:hypothetical protein
MSIVTKLSLASALALLIAAPAQAQSPKQGDYYAPTQTAPQQANPGQEQRLQQGDYYKPTTAAPQQPTPGQRQQDKQGDYYKPGNQ